MRSSRSFFSKRRNCCRRFRRRRSRRAVHASPEMIIGGAELLASTGRRYDVCNPADGQLVGTAPLAGEEDAARAVEAARRALADWRSQTVGARANIIDQA